MLGVMEELYRSRCTAAMHNHEWPVAIGVSVPQDRIMTEPPILTLQNDVRR